MLEGEVTFLVGNDTRTAGKGDFVYVPRNTAHAFRVDSEVAVFLNGYTPAGLELAVIEHAMLAPPPPLPPQGVTPPPAMTPALMRRYGMDNVPGPNPLALDPT